MKYYTAWSEERPISEDAAKKINDRQVDILKKLKPGDDMSVLEDFTFLIPENLYK